MPTIPAPAQRGEFFLDGRFEPATGERELAVTNPASGERLASVRSASPADVDRAVAAARRAWPGWAATTPAARAEALRRIAASLQARRDELASLITAELGAPLDFSRRVQAGLPLAVLGSMAQLAVELEREETVMEPDAAGSGGNSADRVIQNRTCCWTILAPDYARRRAAGENMRLDQSFRPPSSAVLAAQEWACQRRRRLVFPRFPPRCLS